jgi:hypothetical protein
MRMLAAVGSGALKRRTQRWAGSSADGDLCNERLVGRTSRHGVLARNRQPEPPGTGRSLGSLLRGCTGANVFDIGAQVNGHKRTARLVRVSIQMRSHHLGEGAAPERPIRLVVV